MEEYKSGFIAVVGRPNVGKSTLINGLIGVKASIVSSLPQTTRERVRTILTREDFQAIFLDTPGVHGTKDKLDEFMLKEINESLSGVDIIFFVCNAEKPFGPGDDFILSQIEEEKSSLLILNKIDLISGDLLQERKEKYAERTGMKVLETSAKTGQGREEIYEFLRQNLPAGPQYYPEDMFVDRVERDLVADFVREQIFNHTWDEIPYGTAVTIAEMEDRDDITYIRANIHVEKKSHRGIVIGKNGKMLKKIGQNARKQIEELLGRKIYLDLWVKEKKDWRKKKSHMRYLGYD